MEEAELLVESPVEEVVNSNDSSERFSTQSDVKMETEQVNKGNDAINVIELEWRAPKTEVTRYLLRYGMNPDDLNVQVDIGIDEIKQEYHPLHGKLYKYFLLGLPSKTVVYYTLQAENQFGLSEPTPIAKTMR